MTMRTSTASYNIDNNIFTFLHISDTHLSQHKTVSRNDQFNVFTTTILPFISPELVVHSGDITDGWMSAKRGFAYSLFFI